MSTADQLDTIHDQICSHFTMINNFDTRIQDILNNYTIMFNSLTNMYDQQNQLRRRFRHEQINRNLSRPLRRLTPTRTPSTATRENPEFQRRLDSTVRNLSRLFGISDLSNPDFDAVFTIRGQGLSDISGVLFSNDLSNNFFTPVVVRPSDTEIANATTVVFYDPDDHTQTTDPIDQSDFEEGEILTRINYCGHIFREDNIGLWFRSSVFCPLCRHDIRDGNDDMSDI